MYINQYKQFKFKSGSYYPLNVINRNEESPFCYISIFFYDGFPYVYRQGVVEYIKKLNNFEPACMIFQMTELSFDNEKNLAYVSETYNNWFDKEITPVVDDLLEKGDTIALCHEGFFEYVVMPKENLFHLLLKWGTFVDKRVPFILIYQDDKDWYDTASFETKEAMNKFIADHAKQE